MKNSLLGESHKNIYSMMIRIIAFLLINMWFLNDTYSQLQLPSLISDGMILQRDTEVNAWGKASVNDEVKLTFQNEVYSTKADKNGHWKISLPAQKSGGPYEMKISSNGETKEIKDIYFGDIWLCSGQSNMELTMSRVAWKYPDEFKNANHPLIRHFKVPQRYDFNEGLEILEGGSWVKATPETIYDFSAVGFFFAKEIQEKYNVPIGLLNNAVGGSPAEAWINEDELRAFPDHYQEIVKYQDEEYTECLIEADRRRERQWSEKVRSNDLGYKSTSWVINHDEIDKGYSTDIPMSWENGPLGNVHGSVWFKKEFTLTKEQLSYEGLLVLGRITDSDSAWVNNHYVGNITYRYPPRRYNIPARLLKPGKNTLVLRVVNKSGAGGFHEEKDYHLELGRDTIDLRKDWTYRLGTTAPPLASQTFVRWKPIGLYNGMVYPLLNFPVKGVLWYQGESNVKKPSEYTNLMTSLISLWREGWGQDDLPFIITQLANYQKVQNQPYFSNWAWLREQQAKTVSSIPNTALAVAIDIGEWNDIHPLDKSTVGKRLALGAMKVAYEEKNITYSGPEFESFQVKDGKVVIQFSHEGSGLVAKGADELYEFELAGADKKFYKAKAVLEGSKVIVSSPSVSKPVAVRYAWSDNPSKVNFYNKEGLPAIPFRTDDWNE